MTRRRQGRRAEVRVLIVGVALVAAWVGLGYKLFQVQAVNAAVYAGEGEEQRIREEELPAVRGTIYDRDGDELAVSVEAVTIEANPSQISDPVLMARMLAPILEMSEDELLERLSGDRQFSYVARALDRATADRARTVVADLDLGGLTFQPEAKRIYPRGPLAAQVLGFVRSDTQEGLEGLEFSQDGELTGTAGSQLVERDRYGIPIPQGELVIDPAIPGSDVVLTIDSGIQYMAEQELQRALEETGAVAGTVVVIDIDSGEILAMANAPGYDPNLRSDLSTEAIRNRAVADVYEPGSTLKVVTVAAALEEGLLQPRSRFEVPAELEIHDKVYTDVGRTRTEHMTVAGIVARSSNIGTIMIQDMLGNESHHEYLARFGLGTSLGLGLPGEASGLLRPLDDWCAATCGASTAIGYRVDVTPVQMAAVFATIANDGVRVEPHIISEIIDGTGEVTVAQPQSVEVISAKTAVTMRNMLRDVVSRGTGQRAAVPGYHVGGKTGTTEKYIPGEGYSPTDSMASFIGIAPIDRPEVVIAVVLDSPRTPEDLADAEDVDRFEFGGVSAAPVFSRVAEATLHLLGIAPNAG